MTMINEADSIINYDMQESIRLLDEQIKISRISLLLTLKNITLSVQVKDKPWKRRDMHDNEIESFIRTVVRCEMEDILAWVSDEGKK